MWLRLSLFWDVTQLWLVVGFRLFGTAIISHHQGSEYLTLDNGTESFFRNFGNQVQIYAVCQPRRAKTSQNSLLNRDSDSFQTRKCTSQANVGIAAVYERCDDQRHSHAIWYIVIPTVLSLSFSQIWLQMCWICRLPQQGHKEAAKRWRNGNYDERRSMKQ